MARVLNGSTQRLEKTGFQNVVLPVSISLWFYPNSTSGFQRIAIWATGSGSPTGASVLLNYPSAGYVANQVYNGFTNSLPYSASTISTGQWHHALVVSGATQAITYLDGVAGTPSGTYSTATYTNATVFTIGAMVGGGSQLFNGRVAYAAAWNAALTADDAADLGRKLNGVPCGVHPTRIHPESLVAVYPLGGFHGEHDGDIWKDSYNLTPSGTPTWEESPAVIYPSRKKIIFPVSSPTPPSSTKYSWWAWNTFGTPLDHGARS